MIEVQNLSFGYGREPLIKDISCRMENGQVTGLIGANGAGKSTLLRLMARLLKPQTGHVLVDGREDDSTKAFARQLSFLPQNRPTPEMTVEQLVSMGRYAHNQNHEEAVQTALRTVGLAELAGRSIQTLSGGQRQMAYLAMLIAQESPNVLLDEPFTHLDIGAQLDVTRVIGQMKKDGKCVVVVMHDLTMLDKVCDRAVLLHEGKILFDGNAASCLASSALQTAFGVKIIQNDAIAFERC